jgi:hypothetical protein
MARAQDVWRKSGGRISVTARSFGPLYSSVLTAEIQTHHFPQIKLVPFVDPKPWLDLVVGDIPNGYTSDVVLNQQTRVAH